MGKEIKRREISEEDVFRDIRESAIKTIEVMNQLDTELKNSSKTLEKEIKNADFGSAQGIEKFTKAVNQANKAQRDAEEIDKTRTQAIKQKAQSEVQLQRIEREKQKTAEQRRKFNQQELRDEQKLAQEKERTTQATMRTARALQLEEERKARAAEKAAKAIRDENDAYKILEKNTRAQKNESKRLGAQLLKLEQDGKRNTVQYRKLAQEYDKVTTAAKRGDKQLKTLDETVGDNFRSVGDYKKSLEGLKSILLSLMGAFSAVQVIRGGIDIVVDFDQAQGDLQAISGQTEEDLADLTTQAKRLGETTQFSATQVTQLQVELAKLGFTNQQISDSTGAVADFAAATGAGIPEAAALAGSSLRAFNLDASEMDRVVSTLGVATTKSALDFQKLETGLSTVAPVAKAFGFSIEDTTALLGQLANSGFDASSSATATRNILLNLADANGQLAKELKQPIENIEEFADKMGITIDEAKKLEKSFKDPVKTADDLAVRLQVLQHRGIDLASALELTDARSVAAFQTFIDGAGSLVELRDSISGANEELEDMAEKRLDTIAGQATLLASAWEGLILKINEGSGAGETVKNLLGFLAENLGTVVSIMGTAVKLFVIYKARLVALKIAQKLFNDGSGKMSINLKTLVRNLREGSRSGDSFGRAMRGIGWAALIGLALQLANTFIDIANGADVAAAEMEKLNEIKEGSTKRTNQNIDAIRAEIEEYRKQQELLVASGKLTEAIANENIKAFIQQERFMGSVSKSYKDFGATTTDVYRNYAGEVDDLIKVQEREIELATHNIRLLKSQGELKNRLKIGEGRAIITNAKEQIEILKEFKTELNDQNFELDVAIANYKKFTLSSDGATKSTRTRNTEFKNQIDLLRELNEQEAKRLELSQKMAELDKSEEISSVQSLIDKELELQLVRANTEGGFVFTKIQQLIERRKQFEIKAIEDRRDFEIHSNERALELRFNRIMAALEEERTELLAQENLTADERKKIEENYQAELRNIEALKMEEKKTLANQEKVIRKNANNKIVEVERSTAEEISAINKNLVDDATAYAEARQNEVEKSLKEQLKAEIEAAKQRAELAKMLSDYLVQQSDKRISAIEKEISAAERKQQRLEELADSGNIKAEESLAAQQEIINEANKKKLEEEKRKQRIELITAGITTYNSKIAAGSERPLAETIRDISLLNQFISALPAFYDGTNTTVEDALGKALMPGKDGHVVRVDGKEKILNPELSKMTGDLTTTQIAQISQGYLTGKLIRSGEGAAQVTLGGGWDSQLMVDELSGIRKDLKKIPSNELFFDNAMKVLTHKKKSGNSIIYNRYQA